MLREYPAIIEKEPKSDFGVWFPDFDGCVTAGKTPEDAHAFAPEALQLHIDGMQEDGDEIPEPTSLERAYELMREGGGIAVTLVRVRVGGTGRAKRINITLDEALLDEIDQAAVAEGLNRSAYLAEGARRLMKVNSFKEVGPQVGKPKAARARRTSR